MSRSWFLFGAVAALGVWFVNGLAAPIGVQAATGTAVFAADESETLVLQPAPGLPRWGKHLPEASGELQHQARMTGKFVARLKLTGLEKGKFYDLRLNGKAGADGNDVLKKSEAHGEEGVYNFQTVKADDSGSVTVRVRAPKLEPGKYDVKFFVAESNEAEKYPIVLYNNDFVFELVKE